MGSLTDYAENELMNHVFHASNTHKPATTLYVALFLNSASEADLEDGIFTDEADYGQYSREVITVDLASGTREVVQDAIVNTFTQCDFETNVIGYYAICNHLTLTGTDNMLAWGSLSADKTVTIGKTPSIACGEVIISIDAGVMSDYLAGELLDLMFNNVAYSKPSTYIALVETTEILDSDDGTSIDELEMTGYLREAVTAWTITASTGQVTNDAIIDFGTLSAGGPETVTATAIVDNATTALGEVLFYDNTQNQVIDNGDDVQYGAGDFDIELI